MIIVNEGNTPIQGATVSVMIDDTEHTIITDSVGRARFITLPTGRYTFTVTKTGYNTTICSAMIVNSELATAVVSLTRETGHAAITVTDGTNPLSGATVSVTVNGTVQTAPTNELGQATFTNVPTGTYTFTAAKSGYDTNTASVTLTNKITAAGNISIPAQSGGIVWIRVRNENMIPQNSKVVSVDVNGTIQSGLTSPAGYATFINIPVGTYYFYTASSGTNVTVIKDQIVSASLSI